MPTHHPPTLTLLHCLTPQNSPLPFPTPLSLDLVIFVASTGFIWNWEQNLFNFYQSNFPLKLQVLYRGLEKDSFLHGELHPAGLPDQRDLSLCLHDAQRVRREDHTGDLCYAQHDGKTLPLYPQFTIILAKVFLMAVVGNLPPTEKTSIISTTHIIIIIHLRLTLMLRCVLQPHLGGHHVSDRH